jgi:uncharacterized protein YdaU (DUF1376 family)
MFRISWHIGDFRKATRTFNLLEKGVYREMLDEYYDTERPLPLDEVELFEALGARRSAEMNAIRKVLAKKWRKTVEGYVQNRALCELENYRDLRRRKADAGKLGGVARQKHLLEQKLADAKHVPSICQAPSSTAGNHQPLTINHQPSASNPAVPAELAARSTPPDWSLPDGVEFPDGFPNSPEQAIQWVRGLPMPKQPPEDWIRQVWLQAVGRNFKDGAGVQIMRFAHWVHGRWSNEGASWTAKRAESAEKKEGAGFSPPAGNRKAIDVEPSWDWPAVMAAELGVEPDHAKSLAAQGWRNVPGDIRERVLARHEKKDAADWV